jgi:type IV pilus assembly protein PilC
MPTFSYAARTLQGELTNGEIDLRSRDDVVGYLRKQKLIPVKVEEKKQGLGQIEIKFGTGIKTKDIVIFTRQFATMINAGLPLVQSLDILAKQTENKYLAEVIGKVLHDVESGNTLADSMRNHPKVFTDLFVNMVAAGEAGGILDVILLRLATFLEKADALKRKIKGAMIYPGVILGVAVSAVAILLIFVIPTFQTMFESAGVPLPMPTQIVIGMSAFLQGYWWAVLLGIAATVVMIRTAYKTDSGQLSIDRFMLRLPILGNLLRKGAVARFTRTLGTLVASGVSILDGLEITARTAGNRVIHDAVMRSRTSIAGGETIAEPLRQSAVFPPMVIQMINVGE